MVVVSPLASVEVVVLVVLCIVSALLSVLADDDPLCPLCASAGFAGAEFCDINWGVLLSDLGVEDCGVALLSGVVLSGVVVVVVESVLVVLEPGVVAGFAQG